MVRTAFWIACFSSSALLECLFSTYSYNSPKKIIQRIEVRAVGGHSISPLVNLGYPRPITRLQNTLESLLDFFGSVWSCTVLREAEISNDIIFSCLGEKFLFQNNFVNFMHD